MSDPTKYELVSYLASLIAILDSKDDAGGLLRGTIIPWEYERAYAQLRNLLQKEKDDEARQRTDRTQRSESGTDQPQGQRGGGEPTREPRRGTS